MKKELRQEFVKLDEDNCEYIIAGKLGCSLYELIQNIFKKNLLKEFSVVKATLEFYEFYEELVNEFNEKESNVKIINCDEKYLKILRQDWESLNTVRDYVKKSKNKLSLNLNDENVNNEANDENNVNNAIKEEEKKLEIREEFIQL